MTFLLDTNTCIRYLNGRAPLIRDHLLKYSADEIAVCSIVKAELYFGAMKSANPSKTLAAQDKFLSRYISLPLMTLPLDNMARFVLHWLPKAH
jgi:tRNA(fMet)-specific endonuclease VapC